MDNVQMNIRQPQQMMSINEIKNNVVAELTNDKNKVILNIVGYCMLLLGSVGIYIVLFMGKISMGKINISEKNLKKFSAAILVIIWSLFLIAESIKLDDINKIK